MIAYEEILLEWTEPMIDFYLYDDTEDTSTRFVSFVGEENRYDLAVMQTTRFFGKSIVMNMQNNKFGIFGTDDLDEEGFTSYALGYTEEEAAEVEVFLREVISPGMDIGDL